MVCSGANASHNRLRSNPGQAPENRAQQVVVGRASVCVCMSVGASTCVCVCVFVGGLHYYVRALAHQNSRSLLIYTLPSVRLCLQ